MRTLDLNHEVAVEPELVAITDYIQARWELPATLALSELVRAVFRCGYAAAGGWFDHYAVSETARTQAEARKARLVALGVDDAVHYYDCVFQLLEAIDSNAFTLREQVLRGWAYESNADAVHQQALRTFPALNHARPVGYAAFTADYADFDGMAEHDPNPDEAAFDGHGPYRGRNRSLPDALSLPQLAYDDVCQGRSPDYMLVSVIFGHALGLREHNNTIAACAAVAAIPAAGPFEGESSEFGSWGAWVDALLAARPVECRALTPAVRAQREAARQEMASLSKEERKARRDATIARLLAELRANKTDRSARPQAAPINETLSEWEDIWSFRSETQ